VNQWLIKESSWFYVAYSLAEDKIRSIYYAFNKQLTDKAEKLAEENSKKFSLQEMDKLLHGLLDKYVPEFAVEQKIVLPKLKRIELPKLNKIESNV